MCLCVFVYEHESHSVESDSLQPHGLYSPWNSPGQNTGVGSLSLLQGIFPTWDLNPGLLYCRQTLYQLSHKGSPRILEWVVYPFPSGSSQPRNRTRVPCIAGEFLTNWAIREALFSSVQFSSVHFSRSVVSNSLQPHESQHTRPPCPAPISGVHSDSHPSSRWCHPAIPSSVTPFSYCPQSLPASESRDQTCAPCSGSTES